MISHAGFCCRRRFMTALPRFPKMPEFIRWKPSSLHQPRKCGLCSFWAISACSLKAPGGFKALLLPAHAEITLRNFGISFWGETEKPLPVLLVIADQITIDGQSIIQWLGTDLLSDAKADVQADHLERGKSRSTEDSRELPRSK